LWRQRRRARADLAHCGRLAEMEALATVQRVERLRDQGCAVGRGRRLAGGVPVVGLASADSGRVDGCGDRGSARVGIGAGKGDGVGPKALLRRPPVPECVLATVMSSARLGAWRFGVLTSRPLPRVPDVPPGHPQRSGAGRDVVVRVDGWRRSDWGRWPVAPLVGEPFRVPEMLLGDGQRDGAGR